MQHFIRPFASVLCMFIAFAVGFSAPDARAVASAWVDIRLQNGILLLDSKVAGLPGHAMIDTGAQVNSINQDFLNANKLDFATGQAVVVQGIYGEERRRTFQKIPVELFGTTIDFRKMVSLDLGRPELQLLLGASFLELFIFQFDYPNERMRVVTRDSLDMKKLKNIESRRDLRSGDPIVKVRLNDKKAIWLLVDTGNTGGLLIERQVAAKAGWLEDYPRKVIDVSGATSSGQLEQFTLPAMTIGPFELGDPLVMVPLKNQTLQLFEKATHARSRIKSRRTQYQGVLGYDVLKHFLVTIDYKRGYVHLAAGAPEPASTAASAPDSAPAIEPANSG